MPSTGLVDILAGQGGHEDDELVQLLARGTSDEVEARRDRLGKAIADFDAATIETTHGFCLQVLYGLGTAGDVDREVTLVEDVSDLMEEVVDDLFLRRFAHKPNALEFGRKEAMEIAKVRPRRTLTPTWCRRLSQAEDLPSIRRRFAKAVRQEMEDRKKARKILTYDDVLSRLRTTLFDEKRGPAACARLRERYDVVLVDEFQDTDPIQWDIMRRAFGEGGGTLGADRRPQAGDLRVPRRRRPRLPAGPRRRAVRMDPRRQLAQRPGAARGLRRALRRRPARLRRHRLPEGQGGRRQSRAAARRVPGRRAVARPHAARRRRPRPVDRQAAAAQGPPTPRPSSPGTWRPRWCSCWPTPPSSSPGVGPASRSGARRCTPATSPCWCGRTARP